MTLMYAINGKIRLLSPVVVTGAMGDANIILTMDYIPGNVLRGMFASQYIRKKKQDKTENALLPFHQDNVFYRWFLQGDCTFTNACLSETNDGYTLNFRPVPFTFHQNKTQTRIYNLLRVIPSEQTKTVGGYANISGNEIITSAPKKKIRFHHVRKDRLKGYSEDGGIFNYESLDKDQEFSFRIIGREETLQEFLSFFGTAFECEAGRSQNTEYGQVHIQLLDIKTIVTNTNNILDADQKLTISFVSHAVLYNKHGYPDASPDTLRDYLQNALGVGLKLDKCFARTQNIENYVGIWKMKKPLDKAIQAGSVFVISFLSEDTHKLAERLTSLYLAGLGERTNEGYGRFEIVTDLQDNYETTEFSQNKFPERPQGELPERVREIVLQTIKARLVKDFETLAIEHAKSIKNRKPKNSLLGRLELMAGAIYATHRFAEEFACQVEQLRTLAKDQLRHCHVENLSLLDRLSSRDKQQEILTRYFNNLSVDMTKLAEMSCFDFKTDSQLHGDLLKKYWLTFLRRVRKLEEGAVT